MTTPAYDRLQDLLPFDPLEFDRELIELPMMLLEATQEATMRAADRDVAKNELDVVLATAANQLRSTLINDAKGAPKQRSEAQIESEVPLFDTVQKAQTKLERAKYELALWQAMVDAIKAKRDTIKVFADLTISGYLSPNVALDQRKADIRAASSASRRRPINAA